MTTQPNHMTILTRPLNCGREQEIVLVKLWETYLLYHPANLYRILTVFSVDNGPCPDAKAADRVIFRFTRAAWKREIEPLLNENRIPVVLVGAGRHGRRISSTAQRAELV